MKLLFKAAGEGPALVLLHAFPLSATMWDPQFPPLRENNMLIAVNLRGFGGSAVGKTATMEEMADDVAETLDSLKIERAAFLGLSMGGYVALAMWKRHRERVTALVLADSRSTADTEAARAGRGTFAAEVMKGGAQVAVDKMLPKLLSAAAPENAKAFAKEIILANRPEGIAAGLHGLGARPDSTPLLATIDVPALFLCGEKDELTPPADSKAMAAAVKGGKYVEIAGAGHLSNLEAPREFARVVGVFLEGNPNVS